MSCEIVCLKLVVLTKFNDQDKKVPEKVLKNNISTPIPQIALIYKFSTDPNLVNQSFRSNITYKAAETTSTDNTSGVTGVTGATGAVGADGTQGVQGVTGAVGASS